MADFNEILRDSIEKSGYSITKFAQMCNINRSWLSNVLSGKKMLSKSKFENIINSGVFDSAKVEQLKATYNKKHFTDEEVERIQYIISRVSRKRRRNECIVPIEIDEDKKIYFGKLSILSLIYNLLSNDESYSFLYSNIPATSEAAMDVIYHFADLNKGKGKDYRFLYFTNDGEDMHNLNTFFTIFDFAELGITNVSIIENIDIESADVANGFAYYLITDNKMILFDSAFNNAIVTDDEEIINTYIQKFTKLYELGEKYVARCDDAVDLMRAFSFMHEDLPFLSMQKMFCCTILLDYEVLSANANPNLPNKEALIQAVINHYALDYSKYTSMFSITGLNDFAKTGIVTEIPECYLLPLNIESRIRILKKIKENFETGKYAKSYLFNPVKIDYNSSVDIQIEKSGIVNICGYLAEKEGKPNRFIGECYASVKNREFSNDLINLKDYLIENSYVYSNEFAANYAENLIKELEAQYEADKK